MILLQVLPEFSQSQLVGLLQLLIAVALAIIATAILTRTRSVGTTIEVRQIPDVVPEEEPVVAKPAAVDKVTTKIVSILDKTEAVPLENIKQELLDYESVLGDAVNTLIESEMVQISGGMLVLTEKGRRMLELMKEKKYSR
ncbi:MAG: winged helix-turn-helix domain-containing protein [Sulfolobales archaeon]|nr:winged helix-turn-helix domain-containing protein [Sulfolobales archaeon]